ncbi:tetratricopeptide repeat protein [Fulvivirga sediminis]|uniref:Tetratricopeptide repeat protein n=1 Tax=Fulvivirga sediminis TaxID=2803949 RepID=A0A937K1S4_9BACT|nr:tetratricopeptide repeat protein [Fulvivirga sediminis]MBL3657806.1 tetratricopeptide repeat protein [Fulvivirga sediminis]
MLKTRIILFISAAVLVAIIFTLPKVVVDNEENAVPNKTTSGTSHAEPTPTEIDTDNIAHGQAVPADIQKKIDNLKIDYSNSSNIEKSVIFADSLAELYLSINKYDSAAKFVEIIAENIPNEKNWERAGNTYYDAFGFAMDPQKRAYLGEKAREYFLKVMEKTPSNLDVKNKLAMTYLSTSNPMKGIGMLREIIEQDPKNEKAMFNLGVLSMQSNQYNKAVEHFSKLVKTYPNNTQAQFFLGVSYLETGNKDKAKEQFELVKTLDDDPEVQATADSYLEDIR